MPSPHIASDAIHVMIEPPLHPLPGLTHVVFDAFEDPPGPRTPRRPFVATPVVEISNVASVAIHILVVEALLEVCDHIFVVPSPRISLNCGAPPAPVPELVGAQIRNIISEAHCQCLSTTCRAPH